MAFKFGPKPTEEPLKTEKPAELPDDETKEAVTPTEQMPHPSGPFYKGGSEHAETTKYEKLLERMKVVWKERTNQYAGKEDHLLVMKRAGRILNTLTWRHGVHMMTQKLSRLLQEYENPGSIPQELFEEICVDLANFTLLTAEAHGRG